MEIEVTMKSGAVVRAEADEVTVDWNRSQLTGGRRNKRHRSVGTFASDRRRGG